MKTKKILALLLSALLLLSCFTVVAADAVEHRVRASIAHVSANAPVVDGILTPEEYGDPVIVTSPDHVATINGGSKYVNNSGGDAPTAQCATVYMTYDADGLYVAATLDNATGNSSDATGSSGARFAIVVSKYVSSTSVYTNENGLREFFWGISRFKDANSITPNPNNGRIEWNSSPSPIKQTEVVITGKYTDNTYVHEMKIPWTAIPGMDEGVSTSDQLVYSILIADGTKDYYQIAGEAASDIYNNNKHYFNHSKTLSLRSREFVKDAVASMPGTMPSADGVLGDGEYGDPIIVTSPLHASSIAGDSKFINNGVNTTSETQCAKIYMTNDETYLYIAATLDQAVANGGTITGSNGAQFSVTLSKHDETYNVYHNEKNEEVLYWCLSRFNGKGSTAPINPNYGRLTNYNPPSPWKQEAVEVGATFANGTYVHEMKIPWTAIPGMEEGINTDGKLAVTMWLADGSTKTNGDFNGYQIGGQAAKVVWNSGGDKSVLVVDINRAAAMIDNATYFTVDKALAAAESGDTVTLLKDATVSELNVMNGVKFDLNGKVLTADLVTTTVAGGMIQDKTNGQGGIKIAKNIVDKENPDNSKCYLMLNSDNPQLPLYDASFEGYRFFNCTTTQLNTKTGTCKFGFRFTLTNNNAYDLLTDAVNADMELVTDLKLYIDGKEKANLDYHFKPETVASYATEKKNDSASTWAIILTITGFEDLDGEAICMTSAPSIQSSTGVKIVPTENTPATYTYK